MTNKITITKDMANKTIYVTREFAAPVEKVWQAWTDKDILDLWWAPKPWKTETKTIDFTRGGVWLYCMKGPQGETSWSKVDLKNVDPCKSFSAVVSFVDEDGNIIDSFPTMNWLVHFHAAGTGTKVEVQVSFDKQEDMEKLIAMGFEGGFTMALGNLDGLL